MRPIIDMWESYSGWYWYTLEKGRGEDKDIHFGLVAGFEEELGYYDINELKSLVRV
jgi:hypothetical protein